MSEGRESLLARGLARSTDVGYQVDADLAAAMRLCARSGHLLGVFEAAVHEGSARISMSWLCIGDGISVSATAQPQAGSFRIRSFPCSGTLHALLKLAGGLDGLLPESASCSITGAQLVRLRDLLAATGERSLDPEILDRAGIDTESLGAVVEDLSRVVVVTSLRGSPEGVVSQAFSWLVTRGNGLLKLAVSADGSLHLSPAPGTDVRRVLSEVLSFRGHS